MKDQPTPVPPSSTRELESQRNQLKASLVWALAQLPEPKSAMSDDRDCSDYDEQYWRAETLIAEVNRTDAAKAAPAV